MENTNKDYLEDALLTLEEGLTLAVPAIIGEMTEDQFRSTAETPRRFIKALLEMTDGYAKDPAVILSRRFPQQFDEMIVVTDIDFTSLCEHHLLPFIGTVIVGYIPNGEVVGLSKIPRLVDCYAHRLQLQERMAQEVADSMMEHLKPKGVGVIIDAHHQCMSCRGVKKQNARMITSVMRGAMLSNPAAREEFLKFKK